MPNKAYGACRYPGCPKITRARWCDDHKRIVYKNQTVRRADDVSFYKTVHWVKLRKSVLADSPLCLECGKSGRIVPATQVDHIVPRRLGGSDDVSNLQALCKPCHSSKTMTELNERRRNARGK